MKYLNILNNFELNMRKNPELMPSSVNTYIKLIREMVNRYQIDPTIEELNEFIAEKCKRRQPVIKYAIKHYLTFRWRKEVYEKLIKVKIKNPVRKKTYLSKDQAMDIISSINNKEHRLIAKIQFFTGARASEVISIKKSDIYQETEYHRIRIDIIGKGDKKEPIYIKDDIWMEIQPFIVTDNKYLFLKDRGEVWEEHIHRLKVESYYKRYYENLREAANECGIHLATHDWRRSFTQLLRKDGRDIFDIKKALRHESLETTERYFEDDPEAVAKTMLRHQQGI